MLRQDGGFDPIVCISLVADSGVKKGFIKGEALLLLRTNSSKKKFQNRLEEFQKHRRERGYPQNLIANNNNNLIDFILDMKISVPKQ